MTNLELGMSKLKIGGAYFISKKILHVFNKREIKNSYTANLEIIDVIFPNETMLLVCEYYKETNELYEVYKILFSDKIGYIERLDIENAKLIEIK